MRDRVVIDTNILISRLISSNLVPAKAVEKAFLSSEILVSGEILEELSGKLLSTKFDPYLGRESRLEFLTRFTLLAQLVPIDQRIRVCPDPKDDKFLEVALCGNAQLILTGDLDLRLLHPFRGIAILNPADYLARTP